MISLEQVLLLQKKVETAVERITAMQSEITRLKADNDALRSKCAELSNSLAAKAELVSSLETNQGKIEEGILNVLSRLDAIANSTDGSPEPAAVERTQVSFDRQEPIAQQETASAPQQEEIPFRYEIVQDDEDEEQEDEGAPEEEAATQEPSASEQPALEQPAPQQDSNSLNGQFDIF